MQRATKKSISVVTPLLMSLALACVTSSELSAKALPHLIVQQTPTARMILFVSERTLADYPENSLEFDEQSLSVVEKLSSEKELLANLAPTTQEIQLRTIPPCGSSEAAQLVSTAAFLASPSGTSPRSLLLGSLTAIDQGYSGHSLNLSRSQLFEIQIEKTWPAGPPFIPQVGNPALLLYSGGKVDTISVSNHKLPELGMRCIFIAWVIDGSSPNAYAGHPIACTVDSTTILYFNTEERCTMPIEALELILDKEISVQ